MPFAHAQDISSKQFDRGTVTDEVSAESDPCKSAEPKGMTKDFRECSADCKTVCSYKTTVDGVNCFACQQGGDETCKDIGLLDHPHPWCQPGGVCYDTAELYCTAPTSTTTPKRSRVTCTSCKKRPDMCWQKVKNGTTSLTNCRLGCWNGTCKYVGKYKEKEWDGTDEFLHCYECVTPPPPPSCEDLKWGTDWEADCLNQCSVPGYCEEFEFEVGKKNPKACQPADTSVKKGEKGEDDGGGTRTRGGGAGGGRTPKPGEGINDPTKPFGPNETAESIKSKPPCEEVADGLNNPEVFTIEPPPVELERRQRWTQRFQSAVEKLSERAGEIDEHLSEQRGDIQRLESRVSQAQADLKKAKAAARGAENLGAYGKARLKDLKKAQDHFNSLSSELNQSRTGLRRQQASFNKDLSALKFDAQRALYQADPSAQLSESLSRTDSYYEAYRDHERNRQMKKISDNVFADKEAELQSKINRGGENADAYQTQLDNLRRGKQEWDAVYDRRQRMLATDINRMQKENGEIGAGPYDLQSLQKHAGQAAVEVHKQINKLKRLKALMEKAAKNNCPPKGAAKVAEEIDKKVQDLETMIGNLENRYTEIENGFPLSEEDKRQVARSASRVAEGSKKTGPTKTRGDFFLESLAEETVRTITDPRVGFKKAFWYSVGIVEGVGKAIKGLVETGVGVLDLAAETIEGYLHSGDETLFGRDASEALQNFFEAADGNLNYDGIEKLGQSIQRKLLEYEKKLLHTDMDKTVSRVGGNVAGELVVGEAVIAKGLQGAGKLKTLAGGGKALENAGDIRVPRGRTSQTPDIDGLVNKADELNDAGKGTSIGGKADDLAPSTATTPKRPRAPPQSAKDFKGKTLPDKKSVEPRPLADDVAETLQGENGFRADHAQNMHTFAQEKGVFLVVRDGNPDSVKFMNKNNMMPKPMSSKAKTAKAGPETNKGLVVDPTHPQQAAYWDADIAKAKAAGDTKKVAWLEENRAKAVKTWKSYGDEMLDNGYSVNPKTGVIEYTNPVTGQHFDGVHGDYDLHGVFKPGEGAAGPKKVSFGSGQRFDQNGVDVEGGGLRDQLNAAIDPNKRYVQHGGQDDWVPDPAKVPNKPPDPPVTVFMPDGSTPVRLETAEDMKKFYQEQMGVKWEYPDPTPGPGASLQLPTFEFLENFNWVLEGIERLQQVRRVVQSVRAFC